MNLAIPSILAVSLLPLAVQQPPVQPVPSHVAEQRSASGGLEDYVDGVMASQFESHHLAGAVVALVKDGQTVLSKGYGYAEVEGKKRVDGDKTLFRLASVSKLFTWTAVMQLVEVGLLDLDADINEYLTSFQIPEAFGQPVTLRNLMTHTPGFEDDVIGLF